MMNIVQNSKFFSSYILLCIPILFILQSETTQAQNDHVSTLKKVVIDPGHGGRDYGASGAKSKEKDIVLDISLRLGKMITEKYPDVEVSYTRKTDVLVDLDKRAEIANKAHANLFISIHANSVEKGSRCPSGTETFVMGNSRSSANMEVAKRENSVILFEEDYQQRYAGFDPKNVESYIIFNLMQNSFLHQSLDFAAEIQNQFKQSKRVDRQVKQGLFLVLWQTTMPSVLVEVGFICNPEEEKFMTSPAGKETIASSIFMAFSSYKSKIEERSSFRLVDTGVEQHKTDQKTPETVTVQPGTTSKKVEFCVQIATSSKPKDTHPNNFKKYRDVERIQISVENYKYIVGRTNNYATAQETLKKVKADFKDAFLVSLIDGKIHPLAEGLKQIKD